jgi:plasmid stability protein
MAELLLTEVDETVLSHLQELATRHGRTPAQEAKVILAEAVRGQRRDVWAPVDDIYHRLSASARTFSDSADLLREDGTVERDHCECGGSLSGLAMSEPKIEFSYDKGPVGCFQMSECPQKPGVYPYMPYRSGSHYLMHKNLRETGIAECTYVTNDGLVRFKVTGCPEYGRLELSDFRRM